MVKMSNNNTSDSKNKNVNNTVDVDHKKRRSQSPRIPADKVFKARDSLMTEILKIPHIRTVYNIFLVILIIFFMNSMVYDYFVVGKINLGTGLIISAFGKIGTVAAIWSCMQLASFIPYFGLKLWATCLQLKIPSFAKGTLNIFGLLSFIIYLAIFTSYPLKMVWYYKLPIASAFIVILEMIRFLMKTYAYVRSVSPRVLDRNDKSKVKLPTFSWYLYFLFAPTIVYRDSYPRTKSTDWKTVFMYFIEIVATIFYMSFLADRFLIYYWNDFGVDPAVIEPKHMVLAIFGSMLPAQLNLICCFYLLLHCWHNAFSEILTFADRQFYLDWWNQSDYGGYYRTWNTVVHDWLYTYIYKDVTILTGNRTLGQLTVFLVSAVYHEIALLYAFGYFYPAMFVFFAFFGVMFKFITKNANPAIGNIFLWLTMTTGNGLIWCMYGMEYYARMHCPMVKNNELMDALLPRSWFCAEIK